MHKSSETHFIFPVIKVGMRGVKIVVVQSAVFHVLSEDGYKIQWLVAMILL